jgi:hypothetical protein
MTAEMVWTAMILVVMDIERAGNKIIQQHNHCRRGGLSLPSCSINK